MKIGIVGFGNMGQSIFYALKNDQKFSFKMYDPFKAELIESLGYENNLDQLLEAVEIILLCVKPDEVNTFLSKVKKPIQLLTIVAGVKIEFYQKKIPINSKLVRIMPNLPLLIGKGALGYFGDHSLYNVVTEIFKNLSFCLELKNEKLLDSVTGLSGSGPAFVFSFIQALAEGGLKSGLAYENSLELAIETVIGSAELLKHELKKNSKTHPFSLRNQVTSAGGTTIFGLSELEKNNFSFSVSEAVYSATKRAEELAK